MRCFVGARRRVFSALFGGAVLFSFVVTDTAAAQSADTQFDALVCSGESSNAAMVITSPQGDSVVNHSPVMLQGTIYNISQIDVYVDDAYAGTVAVSRHQTTFAAPQSLAEGTHTIRLVGNDICQYQDVEAQVVVTYHPDVSAPTLVDDGVVVARPQTITTAEPVDTEPVADTGAGPSGPVSLLPGVAAIVYPIGRTLDLDVGGSGAWWKNGLRFVTFVAGAGLLVFGLPAVQFVNSAATKFLGMVWRRRDGGRQHQPLADPNLHTHTVMRRVGARVAGLLLLVAVLAA